MKRILGQLLIKWGRKLAGERRVIMIQDRSVFHFIDSHLGKAVFLNKLKLHHFNPKPE